MPCIGPTLTGGHRAYVPGPVPTMGSKRIGVIRGKAVILDASDYELRHWQTQCRVAMWQDAPPEPYPGLVHLTLLVVLERPRSHFYTGSRCRVLRPTAPHGCAYARRDLDKQQRAAGDCATGIWVTDDSRIAWWTSLRLWPGCDWAETYWGAPLTEPGAYLHCEELQ